MTTFVCVDWSKDLAKRAVCVADTRSRRVRRLLLPRIDCPTVIEAATRIVDDDDDDVVVGFDCALGVPVGQLAAMKLPSFAAVLEHLAAHPRFGTPVDAASAWSVATPFFRVPAGAGARGGFEAAAQKQGVSLWRTIDRRTGANPVFITSGSPGSVGSGALVLWRELAAAMPGRAFGLWPFDGEQVELLLQQRRVVVGEMYPRIAYAVALLDAPVPQRSRLRLAKTQKSGRVSALTALRQRSWVASHGVSFDDVDDAVASEDVFDALITAAAFLRCALEGVSVGGAVDVAVEGGILLSGAVNLALPERMWR